MNEVTLRVTGMTCESCVLQVETALKGVTGVRAVHVRYPQGIAYVASDSPLIVDDLGAALPNKYRLTAIPAQPQRADADPAGRHPGYTSANLGIVVIGTGGAAMAAAITAAERGARVTVIERGVIGGTCVNIGCVPSKIMIRAAHFAHARRISPFDSGISVAVPTINRKPLFAQQQALVDDSRGVKYESVIAAYPNISLLRGAARFENSKTLSVQLNNGGTKRLAFDRALIATGARPAIPPIPGLTETPFYSKSRIGQRRQYLVGSAHVVEAANLSSAPRSEYGLLA